MKKIIVVLCILVLVGCSVEEPSPEVYDAVSLTCIEQGKVMYVYKNFDVIKVECVDP